MKTLTKFSIAGIIGLMGILCSSTALGLDPLVTTPALSCFDYQSNSVSYCGFNLCGASATAAPFQGFHQHATWQCCYKSDGTLDSGIHYACSTVQESSQAYPYGCCTKPTVIDDVPECPQLHCDSTH